MRFLLLRLLFEMEFKTRGLEFSPIKQIQAEAERRGAVSLAQGVPEFLPPLGVREAAATAIRQGKADFYGPPQGIESLRKKIAARHLSEEGVFYDPGSEILVTAGALQGMLAALMTFLSPGDELIVPSPSYFPFLNLPKVLGVKPVFVSLRGDAWRPKLSALRKAITPRAAGILLVHPNNPTGTVYTEEELGMLLELAEKRDLLVFVDEVYRYFVYDEAYPSFGRFKRYRNRVIRLMSFSKAFSLSGWRVGYLLADAPLVGEIAKVHEMMTTASASLPAQYAALAALSDFPNLPLEFAEVLRGRRERMRKRLEKLSSVFETRVPAGAYYFFVKLLGGEDDRVFCSRMLREASVALVPGSVFGEEGRGFVRISFAAKEGGIDAAFDRLEQFFLGGRGGESELIPIREILKGAKGVTDDSRKVRPGQVFVAVSGSRYDGHDFIPEAVKKGAAVVVGERDVPIEGVASSKSLGGFLANPRGRKGRRKGVSTSKVAYVKVNNSRQALGLLSSAWHGNPSERLRVVGVTGTDGKTTTSHLLNSILRETGLRSAVLSTLNAPGAHTTTPSALVLQEWLGREARRKTEVAILETTSHAIAQERIAGVQFVGAILTNITPEHLDYHETFARYRDTKARLFRNVDFSVLNRDDPSFDQIANVARGRVVSYGCSPRAEFRAVDVKAGEGGCRFKLVRGGEKVSMEVPLPGEYNVLNVLAAAAAVWCLTGESLSGIRRGLGSFDPSLLTGRFEKVRGIDDFVAVIDFAHTPNALGKVLNYAARIKPADSHLLVVFGCAGERDSSKRPEMGRIAARTADFVVLTSEDPRGENPVRIIDEIARGCFAEGAVEGKDFIRVSDRREAIRAALMEARPRDYLLVLGKGHEPTMSIKGIEYPWNDRKVVEEEWRSVKFRKSEALSPKC